MKHWVLLRGLTREAGHWGAFPARLAGALGADVHLIDLPGNGARHRECAPARIEAIAQDIDARWRAHAVAGPVGVLALSLGAMVALHWQRIAPRTVRALVLVNTSLRPFAPLHWRLRPAAAARLLALLLARDPARIERAVLALTSAGRDTSVLPHWLALRQAHPVSRANALRQLLAAARYRAPPRPAAPLLLLAGRGDRLVDWRASARIAARWNAECAVHPWAGHDLPLDDPNWVIDRVLAFARAVSGARGEVDIVRSAAGHRAALG